MFLFINSDIHNLRTETLHQQYKLVSLPAPTSYLILTLSFISAFVFIVLTNVISFMIYFQVKDRTSMHNSYSFGSHVMQYGDLNLNVNNVFLYIGSNPANDNSTFIEANSLPSFPRSVNQRDADLVYFWQKVCFYYK